MEHTYFTMTDSDWGIDIHTPKHIPSGSCFASNKGFLKSTFCSSPTCGVWRQSLKAVLSWLHSFIDRKLRLVVWCFLTSGNETTDWFATDLLSLCAPFLQVLAEVEWKTWRLFLMSLWFVLGTPLATLLTSFIGSALTRSLWITQWRRNTCCF